MLKALFGSDCWICEEKTHIILTWCLFDCYNFEDQNATFGVNTGENHGWYLNITILLMIFWVFEAFEAFHMSFKSSYSSNKASSTQEHITKIVFESSSPVVHCSKAEHIW